MGDRGGAVWRSITRPITIPWDRILRRRPSRLGLILAPPTSLLICTLLPLDSRQQGILSVPLHWLGFLFVFSLWAGYVFGRNPEWSARRLLLASMWAITF